MASILDSATTMVSDAASSAIDSISDFASSISTKFKTFSEISLPIANPLFDYATFNYILGIGVLTDTDLAFPDKSYLINRTLPSDKPIPLIAKTAGIDPNNRINTPYGKFDFFIDHLELSASIGFESGNNTNTVQLSFDIQEPYSMGLFSIACNQAALEAGHKNWRDAPFLLTVEFRGNTETGVLANIPGTSRYIPFKFTNMSMTVNHTGCVYHCNAMAYNQSALSTKHAVLTNDISVKGKTVQEILQTGEKSLQAVWNKRLQQFKDDKIIEVPDEVIIVFPNDIASESTDATADESGDSSGTATTVGSTDIYSKIGVTKSAINQTQVQDPANCNMLGKASMGFGQEKPADSPYGKDNNVYNEEWKVYVQANNVPDFTVSDFKFSQDTDIPNAINQVLLQSNYPHGAFDSKSITPEGYRKWWRIDVQLYNVSSDANLKSTGVKPKIIVYRVVPYNVHESSGVMPNNVKPRGYDKMNVVKVYNYIYTGKNVDIKKFEIKIENTFQAMMNADAGKSSQDIKEAAENGGFLSKVANMFSLVGTDPEDGVTPTQTSYSTTKTDTDRLGGGGSETVANRIARNFHDQVCSGMDMIMLDMEIIGDPHWIVQSGVGNYTSQQTQFPTLNADSSVNYQSGEVDIIVNFRCPIDINQATGMDDFTGGAPTSELMQFSGLYRVNQLTSLFNRGDFTQVLKGQRRKLQEATTKDEPDPSFSTDSFTFDGTPSIGSIIDKVTNLF
jgi:hypothetical protein